MCLVAIIGNLASATTTVFANDSAQPDPIISVPSYASIERLRDDAALRAVAFGPSSQVTQGAASRIGLAVGDLGVILRSEDAGLTWKTVASPTPLALNDVAWLSDRFAVAAGGGFEPVTGISRGVVLTTNDAGLHWQIADAHDLPRLLSLRVGQQPPRSFGSHAQVRRPSGSDGLAPGDELAPGVIEAITDPSEATGATRFHSFDGGESWREEATTASNSLKPSTGRSNHSTHSESKPAKSLLSVEQSLVEANDATEFPTRRSAEMTIGVAVGDHGVIVRRESGNSTWEFVRGRDRHAAVLFVARSFASVPWSLVGRESLEVGNRVALVVDNPIARSIVSTTESTKQLRQHDLGKLCQAASLLGIGSTNVMPLDDKGRSFSEQQTVAFQAECLQTHRPSVVVLDAGLSPSQKLAWQEAINKLSSQERSDHHSQVARVCETRLLPAHPIGVVQGAGHHKPFRGAILRRQALLPRTAALAGDLCQDALMVVDPGRLLPSGVIVLTATGASSQVRRDVSLTAGLPLAMAQHRSGDSESPASRRRLQIVTARMTQAGQLASRLMDDDLEALSLAGTLDSLLPMTAREDRTRLLWSLLQLHRRRFSQQASSGTPSHRVNQWSAQESVLLERLQSHSDNSAVRRWAELRSHAIANSMERDAIRNARWNEIADAPQQSSSDHSMDRAIEAVSPHTNETASQHPAPSPSQALSPFQVRPVTYEEPSGFERYIPQTVSAPRVLVPSQHATSWPTQRQAGWANAGLATPKPQDARVAERKRTNWEYHPVVLAARGVSTTSEMPATARDNLPSDLVLPSTDSRPRLDGELNDACWRRAIWWVSEGTNIGVTADRDFYFIAILPSANLAGSVLADVQGPELEDAASNDATALASNRVRVSIDRDSDYLTAFHFDIYPDGRHLACADGCSKWSPTWYAASKLIPRGESIPTDLRATPLTIEVAIPRAELPLPDSRFVGTSDTPDRGDGAKKSGQQASFHRWNLRVSVVGPNGEADFQPLPNPQHWQPIVEGRKETNGVSRP